MRSAFACPDEGIAAPMVALKDLSNCPLEIESARPR